MSDDESVSRIDENTSSSYEDDQKLLTKKKRPNLSK